MIRVEQDEKNKNGVRFKNFVQTKFWTKIANICSAE